MNIQFYKPQNSILKKYIEGYYFIAEDIEAQAIRYFTFPNNYCILSVNRHAQILFSDQKYIISKHNDSAILADLVTRYREPLEVFYEHAVDEITLYFKPLGIHYFIQDKLLFEQSYIADYEPYADFKDEITRIFKEPNREKQIDMLENYWLGKFENQNLERMELMLRDMEAEVKMEDMALKYQVSRKHINALFLKYIGKPPSEYRKIYRFRNALIAYRTHKNLTSLSTGCFFYDQSHFIKDFKVMTNTNPGWFFKHVDTQADNIWLFM